MAIPDSQIVSAAAVRYKKRVSGKAAAMAQATADPPSAQRTDYLSRNLAKDRASLLSAQATVKGQPPTAATVQQIAQERIIGNSDLVDFSFMETAVSMGRAGARMKIGTTLATGVQVGPALIMTNNHVIGSADGAKDGVAQFDYQENTQLEMLPVHQFRLNPDRFFCTDPTLDFTIVAMDSVSDKGKNIAEYPWVPLIGQTGKAETGDPINIIQHPNGGLKQIAFRQNTIIDIPREVKDFLYYTTDTEPGSSGSPFFNVQWELVALHHSGVPATNAGGETLKRDGAVWNKDVDPAGLIDWIANEGARISAIVDALRAAALDGDPAALRDQMLGGTPPNPVELARRNLPASSDSAGPNIVVPNQPNPQGATSPMSQSVTLTVPLQITFSIGGVAGAVTTAPVPASIATPPAIGEEVTIDPDWSKRKGYDPDFVGIHVPLPGLTVTQKANTVVLQPQYQVAGDTNLLNYYHYSVKMNKTRRSRLVLRRDDRRHAIHRFRARKRFVVSRSPHRHEIPDGRGALCGRQHGSRPSHSLQGSLLGS